MCPPGRLHNITKNSSSKQSKTNTGQKGVGRKCRASVFEVPAENSLEASTGSQWFSLTWLGSWVTLQPLVQEGLTVMAALKPRYLRWVRKSQGNAHLIGADNTEEVAELNQQAIDNERLSQVSDFKVYRFHFPFGQEIQS